jgi:acetyl-CoA carboxylase biotin carboxyl carrier protein
MKKVIDQALDLLKVADRFDIEDIEVEVKGGRLHLSKGGAPLEGEPPPVVARVPVEVAPVAAAAPAQPDADDESRYATIASPMVGTFYRSPAPDKPPFVDLGQTVEVDQPVCIIEAMKLMNEIKSSIRGRVVKILVENQNPVQAGQVLFLLDPL